MPRPKDLGFLIVAGKKSEYRRLKNRDVEAALKERMRARARKKIQENPDVFKAHSLEMPNTVSSVGDVAKSNIREYPYLPEWVKDSFAPTTVRNPLNATDLYAASRIMVQSQAAADGKRVRGRKLRRLTQAERRFAEGRMMLYSPLGRGAVTTG